MKKKTTEKKAKHVNWIVYIFFNENVANKADLFYFGGHKQVAAELKFVDLFYLFVYFGDLVGELVGQIFELDFI